MEEELRIALSKKEKVELFLANLDKLKAEEAIENATYQDLKTEYTAMLEKIRNEIKSVRANLRNEFDRKASELETLQKEHDLLEARFSVGEIRAESYRRQMKPLKPRIEQLRKEVPRFRTLLSATSTSEFGGPAKVDIPELKVKKVPRKPRERTEIEKKPAPSKDSVLVSELVKDGGKTALAEERRSVKGAEKAYVKEKREGEYRGYRKNVTSGKRAAVIVVVSLIIVVIIFVVGRTLATLEDRDAPIISGVSANTLGSAVTIEWLTNEKATSQVILREPEGDYVSTETNKTLVTEHSVEISDVKPGVRYQVTLKSADARGNEATYDIEQTLVLGTQVDLVPPVISDVAVSDITDTGAAVIWKTDEPSTSQVMVSEIGSEEPYLTEPVVSLNNNHSVILFNLKPNVTYTFTLISKDASGNQAMYDLGTMFTTLSSFPVGPEIGKRAPDFTLQTVDDSSLTLSSFRGKTVMVKFWQKACPACVREIPVTQSFLDKFPEDKMVILAVNAGDNAADVKEFVERWKIEFPVLLDLTRKVAGNYGVSSTPVTFFIDSQGIIRVIKNGAFENADDIESTVNSMFNKSMGVSE